MYIESHCRYRYTESKDAGQTITRLSSLSEPQLHLGVTVIDSSHTLSEKEKSSSRTERETCLHFRRPCPPLNTFHDDTGQLISIWGLILSLPWPPTPQGCFNLYAHIPDCTLHSLCYSYTISPSHWFFFHWLWPWLWGFYLFIYFFIFWGVYREQGYTYVFHNIFPYVSSTIQCEIWSVLSWSFVEFSQICFVNCAGFLLHMCFHIFELACPYLLATILRYILSCFIEISSCKLAVPFLTESEFRQACMWFRWLHRQVEHWLDEECTKRQNKSKRNRIYPIAPFFPFSISVA